VPRQLSQGRRRRQRVSSVHRSLRPKTKRRTPPLRPSRRTLLRLLHRLPTLPVLPVRRRFTTPCRYGIHRHRRNLSNRSSRDWVLVGRPECLREVHPVARLRRWVRPHRTRVRQRRRSLESGPRPLLVRGRLSPPARPRPSQPRSGHKHLPDSRACRRRPEVRMSPPAVFHGPLAAPVQRRFRLRPAPRCGCREGRFGERRFRLRPAPRCGCREGRFGERRFRLRPAPRCGCRERRFGERRFRLRPAPRCGCRERRYSLVIRGRFRSQRQSRRSRIPPH
jgi:hypothetical protein